MKINFLVLRILLHSSMAQSYLKYCIVLGTPHPQSSVEFAKVNQNSTEVGEAHFSLRNWLISLGIFSIGRGGDEK